MIVDSLAKGTGVRYVDYHMNGDVRTLEKGVTCKTIWDEAENGAQIILRVSREKVQGFTGVASISYCPLIAVSDQSAVFFDMSVTEGPGLYGIYADGTIDRMEVVLG